MFSPTDLSLLRSCALLRELPDPGCFEEALRDVANHLLVPADTVVIPAGTVHPGLHLVAHGTIEMVVLPEDGGERIVDFARTGGVFAEESLFEPLPVRYTARTLTSAAILRLPETVVSDWMSKSPEFCRRLIGMLAERTDYLQKDMVTFCTKGATARLVCYLVCQFNHAPKTPDGSLSLNITVPRNKLASRLGISDSHLSRAFKELETQGLVVKQRNGIFIPDVQALSRYVCPAGCDW